MRTCTVGWLLAALLLLSGVPARASTAVLAGPAFDAAHGTKGAETGFLVGIQHLVAVSERGSIGGRLLYSRRPYKQDRYGYSGYRLLDSTVEDYTLLFLARRYFRESGFATCGLGGAAVRFVEDGSYDYELCSLVETGMIVGRNFETSIGIQFVDAGFEVDYVFLGCGIRW